MANLHINILNGSNWGQFLSAQDLKYDLVPKVGFGLDFLDLYLSIFKDTISFAGHAKCLVH